MKKILSLLWTLLVSLCCTSQILPTIDGKFCDSIAWGNKTATDPCGDTPTGTADLKDGWFFIDSVSNTVYMAWTRCATGAGTSTFGLKFDTDCDNQADAALNFGWDAIGNNNTKEMQMTFTDGQNSVIIGNAIQGSADCIANSPENGKFTEMKFSIDTILNYLLAWGSLDPCNCICGHLKAIFIGSLAGGSINSAEKDEYNSLLFTIDHKVNSCPVINFTTTPNCPLDTANIAVTFSDDYPLDDSHSFSWTFSDGTTSNNQHPAKLFATGGAKTASVLVTDQFGCTASYSSSFEVNSLICFILPVTSLNIYHSVDNENCVATINWSTVTELNVDYFVLETSLDGKTFKEAATTNAIGINNNDVNSYRLQISLTPNVAQYYRIKIVDIDRLISYSKTKVLNCTFKPSEISLSPNPASDFTIIHNLSPNSTITITNTLGSVIEKVVVENDFYLLNTTHYASGLYLLKVIEEFKSDTFLKLMVK